MESTHAAYDKMICHRQAFNHQIEIFYETRLTTDRSDTNRSLARLLPGNSASHWKTPPLARGVDPQTDDPVDLDTNDVPAILDYLASMSMHRSLYPEKFDSSDE